MRRLFALLAALVLVPSAAQAAEAPLLDGVWKGTIGTLPVRVCLMDVNASSPRGSYYYLSQMKPIALEKPDGNKGWLEQTGAKARWSITLAGANKVTGSWTTGDRTLPVSLTRVAMGDDGELDGACWSDAFMAPRIIPTRLVASPVKAGKLAYSKLKLEVGKWFEEVDIATFQIPVQRPGDKAINLALRALIDPKQGRADYASCLQGNLGLSGTDGEMSLAAEPSFVSAEWIDVQIDEGNYCGGAHPNYSSSHMVYDRASGKEVQLAQWLAPKGMSAKWDAGAKYWDTRLLEPLRKLVLAAMPPIEEADCQSAVAEAESWDLALTPKGITFTPFLPHAMLACADDAELTFAQLAPYLSPAGKAGVARMKAPVLLP
ncbi:hypothetical protein [Novosphingobium sp. B 225]|uniref:hypothetical protein n=1 Tax=Novosphingobium sp. B 225 TaxID=1961849 RepID=UPI000B4AC57F|nr:hypothetical protein [Novosphingobium sp. B 225]